jgi:hypothetical protein
MMKSLRAKLILCSVCSAALHGLFLEQFIIGQTASNRPISGSSDLQIRYIPSFISLPAVEITSAKQLPTDSGVSSLVKPVQAIPIIRNEILESAVSTNEFVVVENFYESSEVDEPATPDTDWPIVVEGMTRGLIFNVQVSIWISSLGRIERVEVLQIQPESEKVRHSLQTMVGTTVKPALRAGVNVANKRTIELWLTQ